MDLSTLWCYKLWKVIHTEISVTISVRGVLRWRNAALLGSRANFKRILSELFCLVVNLQILHSRYVNGHAKTHYEENRQHSVCLDASLTAFW